jgi:hypothetical protein
LNLEKDQQDILYTEEPAAIGATRLHQFKEQTITQLCWQTQSEKGKLKPNRVAGKDCHRTDFVNVDIFVIFGFVL